MKAFILVLFFGYSCFSLAQENIIVKDGITIIDAYDLEDFSYYWIKKNVKASIDEVYSNVEINIFSESVPKIDRIIESCNEIYAFPLYYILDKRKQFVVVNPYSFILDMDRFVNVSGHITVYGKEVEVFKNREYTIFKRDLKKGKVLKISITVGLYNKYTNNMHLSGDFDEQIEMYYIY